MDITKMSSSTKIIAGVLVVGAVLIGAYFIFFNTSSDTSAVSASGAPASAAEVTFLDLASKAEPISFDTSIFTDGRFISLVDIHQAIVPVPAGRTNPFQPIPSIDGANTTGTTQ